MDIHNREKSVNRNTTAMKEVIELVHKDIKTTIKKHAHMLKKIKENKA